MTVDQEDIKRLMDELNFPAFNGWGYSLMMKFYQRAQSEAYEKAAQVCDEMDRQDRTSNYYAVAARAIRKLKEESCKS